MSEETATANSGTHRRRVLVVDDGPMNRRLAERMLRHLGCEVFVAEDAASAVEILAVEQVEIVFTDITMPDMEGTEALQLFRDTAAGAFPGRDAALMVVAVSGDALGDDPAAYVKVGFDNYIPKPISVEAFRAVIDAERDNDKT